MIRFDGKSLTLGDTVLELEHPIQEVHQLEDLILVLFRPESYSGAGQFPNLVALDLDGRRRWVAELPTSYSMDAYYKVLSVHPLIANSFCSFRCEIHPRTGKIVAKEFYK